MSCFQIPAFLGYADEIRTWMGGWGMDGLLESRAYVLNGITNGIDYE
jgi:starch synthase